MDSTLKVQVAHETGVAIVKIEGEARLQLRDLQVELDRLSAEHPPAVILDLAGLTMMSSLGMGLFVSLRNSLKRRGGRLLAAAMQPMVLDSFKRARLDGIFELFETLEAAKAAAQ